MITFLDDEKIVNGVPQWVEIHSEYSDYISFAMGQECSGEHFAHNDPIAMYTINGEMIPDILKFARTGEKASWMGKPAGAYTFQDPETDPFRGELADINTEANLLEMQNINFEAGADTVTISVGRYPSHLTQEDGHYFCYEMPSKEFESLAVSMMELHEAVSLKS